MAARISEDGCVTVSLRRSIRDDGADDGLEAKTHTSQSMQRHKVVLYKHRASRRRPQDFDELCGTALPTHGQRNPSPSPTWSKRRGRSGPLVGCSQSGLSSSCISGFWHRASNLVLGGEALASTAPGISDIPSIVLVGVLSVVAAIFGHDFTHGVTGAPDSP
jgi:hypothetical protein